MEGHPPATFNRAAFLRLIRNALPIPPETEADNDRLIQILMEIDDRGRDSRAYSGGEGVQ